MGYSLNQAVLIVSFILVVISAIIIGVLFAVGVLKANKPSGSSPTPPTPPTPPNPTPPTEFSTTLSNPIIQWESGHTNLPYALTFNIQYNPDPMGLIPNWNLVETIILTFADGSTSTDTRTVKGASFIDTFNWQPISGQFGLNRNPVRVDLSAYMTYVDSTGSTITCPVSNTLSVNIPTNY